jgi:hypothetical protein
MYQVGYHHTEEEKEKIRQGKLGAKNPNYGKKLSVEIRAKMSASKIDKRHFRSPETIAKHRESLLKFYNTDKGKDFKKHLSELAIKNTSHKGYKHSPESLEKMKIAKIGHTVSKETRRKMILSHQGKCHPRYGLHLSDEYKKKISDSLKRLYQTPRGKKIREFVDNLNRGNHHHTGHKHSPESIEKMKRIKTGKKLSDDTKHKMRESQKKVWGVSIDYKNERVGNIVRGNRKCKVPNSKETMILNMLQELQPNTWKYVGDGSLKIGGKNPDIWNGKDKLIEHYGYHWHRNHNPQDRIDLFAKYGYKTLIIQEMDLIKRPEYVKELIKTFINS